MDKIAPASHNATAIFFPVLAFPVNVTVRIQMQPATEPAQEGSSVSSEMMSISLIPNIIPSTPLVVTIAGLQEVGLRRLLQEDGLPDIHWWDMENKVWTDVGGTTYYPATKTSVVELGVDLMSNPSFGWRLMAISGTRRPKTGIANLNLIVFLASIVLISVLCFVTVCLCCCRRRYENHGVKFNAKHGDLFKNVVMDARMHKGWSKRV